MKTNQKEISLLILKVTQTSRSISVLLQGTTQILQPSRQKPKGPKPNPR